VVDQLTPEDLDGLRELYADDASVVGVVELAIRLRDELAVAKAALEAIKAADPDLFDPTGGNRRGRAYETYGSAGHDLRERYLAAVGETLGDGDE
jgi:hypothetical protein